MTSIEHIEAANRQAGRHFFDASTLRFFDSRIGRTVYEGPGGIYFTTSEQFHGSDGYSAPRKWSVRQFDPATGHIETIGEHGQYETAAGARAAARAASRVA